MSAITHEDLVDWNVSQFQAGDMVECIDVTPRGKQTTYKLAKLAELKLGGRYTVSEAYDYRRATGSWALILAEIETPFPYSWDSTRFSVVEATNA